MLSISVYSYEELQEYKVELIIFKYSTPNANELFDSILKIPDMEIINNYSIYFSYIIDIDKISY